MSELISNERKDALRKILDRLHAGESPEALKEEFKELLGEVTPLEISRIEAELVEEGTPREELMSLCDVHMAMFKESLSKEPDVPDWHPIHILHEEHRGMLEASKRISKIARDGANQDDELQLLAGKLADTEVHYQREENVLFPYLEKHGITEPPAIMWMEHDRIRAERKALISLIEAGTRGKLLETKARGLYELFAAHFQKEGKILFPSAIQVITEAEWKRIRKEFDGIGYTPFACDIPPAPPLTDEEKAGDGEISFTAGSLSLKELTAVLDALPVDITFIDANDRVRYFNQAPGRVFVRSPAIIGRAVQNCHPQKSVAIVNRILKEFEDGQRDQAEFWIKKNGKTVYIRYFPVRGESGVYLGTLEVTQDITRIMAIEGEKTLVDEA
ncbi:MAG: DUF438 domain-containing protein [Candidatus Bipolaricaulota bacterium]|nr:DUF438 domain-containing protein [Candidatus Bipolaricaulota bacterium]